MELLGLNSSFVLIKTLRCTNIRWNRRYYEAGDFQLELLASDWDTSIAYIYTHQRPETGMVQKIETEHTIKGEFVLVSGFFLEGMRKIIEGGYGVGLVDASDFETVFCEPDPDTVCGGGGTGQKPEYGGVSTGNGGGGYALRMD